MYLFRIFLVLMSVWVIEGYRILCLLPYPGKSHMMVFEPLLQELSARGHQLTVVSFFPTQTPAPNRRDVSLVGIAPIGLEVVDINTLNFNWYGLEKYFAHVPSSLAIANSNLQLCKKLLNHPVMEEFVHTKGNYDMILVEQFNSDCMLGIVHEYGLPFVGLMSSSMLPWSYERVGAPDSPAYVPGMSLDLTDKMSFFQRLENAFFLAYYLIYFEIYIRPVEQQIVEKSVGHPLPKLEDIAKNTSFFLINMHHDLNGIRVFPPSMIEVGGIHLHNRSVNSLPEELEQWISESKEGFILFSFGSLIRGSTMPAEQLDAIMKVFAKLPQRVIWKWEADTDNLNLPKNVKTVRWVPQYDLLHHPKLVGFFTHGGLLSMMEAVSAGAPMLVVPILGDQFGNAAHAKAAGIAQVLYLREINERSLYAAMKVVLSNETRTRVKRLSQMWNDRPQSPMDTAIYHIERLGRYKTLQLSSQARYLSKMQLTHLDIIAFVILILVLMTYFVYHAFKVITKKFTTKVKLS